MLIRQSVNTYIRVFDNCTYVENQVNHVSRTYDGIAKYFVDVLSRKNRDADAILEQLHNEKGCYNKEFFLDLIHELKDLWFVVTGDTEAELDADEKYFAYNAIQSIESHFNDYISAPTVVSEPNTPWLRSLQFEVTSYCNEKCIHCYIPGETKIHGISMPEDKIKTVIDEFASMGGLRIIFSGGELFLYKGILDILRYCREKDLMIFLQSNMTLADDETLSIIKQLNVFNVQISLYSMNEETHDAITRVKGSWQKTKNNIEKLVKNNVPIMISCPIMQQNYRDYKELYEYAKSLNVFCYADYVLLAQNNFSKSNLCTRMTMEQTDEFLDVVIASDSKYETIISSVKSQEELDSFEFAQRFKKCDILKSSMCISSNGDVYPCPAWQNMVIGNVYNNSLQDIWLSSPKGNELRNINKDDFKKCKVCKFQNYCDMCPVYNYNENNGNLYEVCTRFCDVAGLFRKKIHAMYIKNN